MEYSVVVPVYNSQDSLEELFQRIKKTFEKFDSHVSFEVVFVDDFSKDKSWEVLMKLKKSNPEYLKIINFGKNFGQHNAVLCGFRYVSGNRIITIDDDLQQAPEDIALLIERMNTTNADLVYGVGGKNHSNARKIGSKLYKQGAKHIDGKYGEGSSFRLISEPLVKKVIGHKQHFVLIEEILYWYTECIEVVKVSHQPRKKGKSGYSPFKIFRFVVNISVNYSNWPLKFMIYGGAIFSFFSFLLGIYFICKKIFLGVAVPGFTALIVAIFFSTSILLLCFGIVGKYLYNIYDILNEKPTYSIKEAHL